METARAKRTQLMNIYMLLFPDFDCIDYCCRLLIDASLRYLLQDLFCKISL